MEGWILLCFVLVFFLLCQRLEEGNSIILMISSCDSAYALESLILDMTLWYEPQQPQTQIDNRGKLHCVHYLPRASQMPEVYDNNFGHLGGWHGGKITACVMRKYDILRTDHHTQSGWEVIRVLTMFSNQELIAIYAHLLMVLTVNYKCKKKKNSPAWYILMQELWLLINTFFDFEGVAFRLVFV